jgi:hypothetical protein
MLRYDPHRSEFAVASIGERLLHVALLVLALAAAVLLLVGNDTGPSQIELGLVGAIITMASVPFAPGRSWRMVLGLISVTLMLAAVVAS